MNHPRILFYVQHLLGSGHLLRACLLANYLAEQGFAVTLVSGGMDLPKWTDGKKFRFVQLPPLQSPDAKLDRLVDQEGAPPTPLFLNERRQQLLHLFQEINPDILITETYPFGRGSLRFELEPLIQLATTHHCLILSSIRDVLNPPDPEKKLTRILTALDDYHGVLVHGDQNLIPLEASFPATSQIQDKIHYTGYVAQTQIPLYGQQRQPEIIVSAGGGRVGEALWETAWDVATTWPDENLKWRFLIGQNLYFSKKSHADRLVVEPNRPDFLALLAKAKLSISQCGYNTAVDLFLTRTPAIVVPFVGPGGEAEQTIRAHYLEKAHWCRVLPETNLTHAHLNNLIQSTFQDPYPQPNGDIDLNGRQNTALIIHELFKKHYDTRLSRSS